MDNSSLALKFSFPYCPAKNNKKIVAKDGGDQIGLHVVPIISTVGGDASHGSHRAVAPMPLPGQ